MDISEMSVDEILKSLEKDDSDKNKKKDKETDNQIVLNNSESFEIPKNSIIKKYYDHIQYLRIELFIIETKTHEKCGYCEAWKNNTLERKYFSQLHKFLGLDENIVNVTEIECDWNCLHATDYYDDKGVLRQYPTEIDIYGENYFYAYGMDIEYFPAIRLILKSTKYEQGKKNFEAIFQGLGSKNTKKLKYIFNKKEYFRNKEVEEVLILKPIMRFLRSLTTDNTDIPIHEKFSIFLGQFHRHVEQ